MRIGARRDRRSCSLSIVSPHTFRRAIFSLAIAERCHLLDRLVDSGKMKKAIESLYTAYLPKGASPFVYIRYVSDYLVHNAFSRLI
jgi:hypothetical protein